MVLHAQIQAAAVCCKSQSIPLFGRHAVFRFDVVGDLGILPRTCAQREVALLTAPDIELMADQIRRDARQQIRRLFRVDNARLGAVIGQRCKQIVQRMDGRADAFGRLELHDEECARQFGAEVISDRDEPVEQLPDALKVIICVRKLHEALVVIVLRFFHHVFEDAAFAVERGVEHGAGDAARFADIIDGHVVISAALKEGNGCFRDFLFEFPGRILHFKHP